MKMVLLNIPALLINSSVLAGGIAWGSPMLVGLGALGVAIGALAIIASIAVGED